MGRTFNSGVFRWFALVKHELKIEEGNNFAIRTKMGWPSNSNWCVLNVIWLTGYWICVTVAIFAAQIMRTEKDLVHDYPNLPMALILIGFVFDLIVCFVEFIMVDGKLDLEDEEPGFLYCVESLLRVGFYSLSFAFVACCPKILTYRSLSIGLCLDSSCRRSC